MAGLSAIYRQGLKQALSAAGRRSKAPGAESEQAGGRGPEDQRTSPQPDGLGGLDGLDSSRQHVVVFCLFSSPC